MRKRRKKPDQLSKTIESEKRDQGMINIIIRYYYGFQCEKT